MPRGVYPRTPNQLRAAKANLAKGREPAAREKAAARIREIARDLDWRDRVSAGTTAAMRRPDVRERHLAALAQNGVNFKGGNGQEPVRLARDLEPYLSSLGFVRELPVKTRGHATSHSGVPTCYKVDFGHLGLKIGIELDGPAHRPRSRQVLDVKKTEVLESLGWKIVRVRHD